MSNDLSKNIEIPAANCSSCCKNTAKDYFQIGVIFLIVVALYLMFKELDLLPNIGITENMTYGFVFLIGLLASLSTCTALTGGMLLAIAGKYNQKYPELSGIKKFRPHLYFNFGRIIAYTVFGGLVGLVGSIFTLSPKINGSLIIVISVIMLILGFQLLKIFSFSRNFGPKMPQFLINAVDKLTSTENKVAPFLLGAVTFFFPCGFTQAIQLYVLTQGDFVDGGLTMFFFALGTLPALISLSFVSSFVKGAFKGYFLKLAGIIVILLAVFNMNNGLVLTGNNISLASIFKDDPVTYVNAQPVNVEIKDGRQIVKMKVEGLDYYPNNFTLYQGVPVEWQIEASQAVACAQVLTVPELGITKYLNPNKITIINFTPENLGRIIFSCSMGMTTAGSSFNVIKNTKGIVPDDSLKKSSTSKKPSCNPEITTCANLQSFTMEVSEERGFYPNVFVAKKAIPIEFIVDVKVPLGGCMSVLVIPQYDIAETLKIGRNIISFTPSQAGILPVTCSMGMAMGEFQIID